MSYQSVLFSDYLDPIKLKAGKEKCPCCKRPMKAYGYNLDQKLVSLALDVYAYCGEKQSVAFNPKNVWPDNVSALTQFQKLKCHGIIERSGMWWTLTKRGYKFVRGEIKLPKKVWVFDDKIILKEDEFVSVEQAEPRWKETYQDWVMDYILTPYETEPRFL